MRELELVLILACVLVLLSIVASKAAGRSGVPALLLFLGIGMLAGSEGLGGIYFDDAGLARSVGVVALALILFSGGLDTRWTNIRPGPASIRPAAGTWITAGLVDAFAMLVTGLSLLEALLRCRPEPRSCCSGDTRATSSSRAAPACVVTTSSSCLPIWRRCGRSIAGATWSGSSHFRSASRTAAHVSRAMDQHWGDAGRPPNAQPSPPPTNVARKVQSVRPRSRKDCRSSSAWDSRKPRVICAY